MSKQPSIPEKNLRILHVMRAPVGGLFRHVIDLTREQVARGHTVGIVADSTTGGARAEEILGALAPSLELGLLRIPMRRAVHLHDLYPMMRIARHASRLDLDVIHGHGSKGGAYARIPGLLAPKATPIRAYTPHGGSFHYHGSAKFVAQSFMKIERLLIAATDVFFFESAYIAQQFRRRCGPTTKLVRIAYNGLNPHEFLPVTAQAETAEFLYIGELRAIKGLDTLLDAVTLLSQGSSRPRLVLVGAGPEESQLRAQAERCGIAAQVTFAGAMPARKGFALGRVLVVPSRAESLPYVVLEAAAAHVPLVATDVGGVAEIFGPFRDRLIAPGDARVLADALQSVLARPISDTRSESQALASFVSTKFKISDMTDAILAGYHEALANKHRRAAAGIALPAP